MAEADSKEAPFRDHLNELRRRIFIVVVAVFVFSVVGYEIYPKIYSYISKVIGEGLFMTKVYEGFLTRLKVGLVLGIFLAIPVLLYEVLAFVLPALNRKEKVFLLLVLSGSLILFISGLVASVKLVLPLSINALRSDAFNPGGVNRIISYDSFTMFFVQFAVAFGACLQFPVVLMILMYYKVVRTSSLIKFFKYFIPLDLLIAGILTPTPDLISQIMLALPLLVLYLACIALGKLLRWS